MVSFCVSGKLLSESFERETPLQPESRPAPALLPLSPVSSISPVRSHSPAAPPQTTGSPFAAAGETHQIHHLNRLFDR